jgi:large subunit ribosomal protein L23
MREPYDILVKPRSTEKSTKTLDGLNQYTFEVSRDANKIEIRQAVERAFDLKEKVLKVRTMNYDGKWRRKGRSRGGYRPDWKKALITLVKGAKIKDLGEA